MRPLSLCLLLFLSLPFPQLAAASCKVAHYDSHGIVSYIHDGDTLWLEDGRKIRLLGINTPELARKHQSGQRSAAEPFAEAARDWLRQHIRQGDKVDLLFDTRQHDRYQRTLAHVFHRDTNLQAKLLERGLAETLTLPPNTRLADCYSQLEQAAFRSRRGLWQHPDYRFQSLAEATLTANKRFRIRGAIVSRHRSAKNLWLNLSPEFALKIAAKDLPHFARISSQLQTGTKVRARGWLYQQDSRWVLQLRHSNDLQIENGR